MVVGIFIFLLFVIMGILGYRAFDKEEKTIKDSIGRNHAILVTSHSVGGDYHFDEMNDEELYDFFKNIYEMCHVLPFPCMNADDSSHLAEFNIFTDEKHTVKTIGYVTKDKVVFEGKEYHFN